jgi:hypothetical protein
MHTMTKRKSVHSERGAVMVMVAAWLPVLALLVSFAIDFAHFFDYSRNLQNRVDAATLAGGHQLAICLGSPTLDEERRIGEIAEQYSGPPYTTTATPFDSLVNLPYSYNQMTSDGFPSPPYLNALHLSPEKGQEEQNFHLLLNSSEYWPTVAQNGPDGYGDMGSYCHAVDPAEPDPSDPNACVPGNTCAMVDSRITQANVPLFFKLLGFQPNISAHARVQLKIVGGFSHALPIGVGDAGESGCLVARVVDETNPNAGPNSDGVISQWSLSREFTIDPVTGDKVLTNYWSGPMPGTLSIPATSGKPDQLAVQAVIPADCSDPFAGGDVYDAPATGPNAGHGIVFVNTYTPLPADGTVAAPTRGSVWLEQGPDPATSCTDPYFNYFTSGSCTVRLRAQVDFPTPPPGTTYGVSVSKDGAAYQDMPFDTTDSHGNKLWANDFSIQAESGRHTFALSWYYKTGGSGPCTSAAAGSNKNCQFNGGAPVQATFSAFADGTGIDDSGPVIEAHVGCTGDTTTCPYVPDVDGTSTAGAPSGANSIPGSGAGSSPTLTVRFKLLGLQSSAATDKPTILRSSVQGSKRTGIFDCGQGPNASGFDQVATGGGCGTYPGTSSLSTYTSTATWTSGQWPDCTVLSSDPIDCAEPVPGNMRQPVNDAIAIDVCGDKNCASTPSGKACDYWEPYKTGDGPLPNPLNDTTPQFKNDPRAIPMVITAPQDLALPINDPRWIRILGFAVFYVTGWDGDPYIQGSGTTIPGCDAPTVAKPITNGVDEPYPYGTTPKNAVWGHFIAYTFFGANPGPNKCVVGGVSALACTPALTR